MFYQKETWKDWRVYYKLFFAILIGCGIFAALIESYVHGITVNVKNPTWTAEATKNFINDKGDYTFNYFSYFTMQTNLLVFAWLLGAGLFPKYEGKSKWLGYKLTLAITTYISITFLIFNLMLLPFDQPQTWKAWLYSTIQHVICPIAMIVYFLFFMERQNNITITKVYWRQDLWKLYFYPIAWAIVNMIRGEFRWQAGKAFPYQYFFLNIHASKGGIPGAVWFVIAVIAVSGLVFGLGTLYNYCSYNLLIRKKL
ncbi:Pr6Pr family membrane protein [Spiroplasma sp. SV19]|uniref:Pr6Pr family membrane protein n=1 Tax=Spiroplasma sp. SV19 TaxID=2570468 RepID=UPI0024B70381|nr:Pr6Pr family membrane protein [Spiroplasma sp. SV19]WHQ36709.1 hypothetical protein E7Y35_02200 [Spiroplasma sp. SV19]